MNNLKLTPKNLYFVLIGIISLLCIASIAIVVLGNTMLEQKNQKLTQLKLESEVLERQKQDVVAAKSNIQKYEELNQVAKQIVPQDKDQAKTVREIVLFAQASGVGIKSISFPTSELGQKAAPVAKPVQPSDSEGGSSAPAAPAAPAAPPVSQVKPVAGLNGVYELEVSLLSTPDTATFGSLISFLKELESNRRTSQVSSMQITPSITDRNKLTFTINFKVFVKP